MKHADVWYLIAALALCAFAVSEIIHKGDFWGPIICANLLLIHARDAGR